MSQIESEKQNPNAQQMGLIINSSISSFIRHSQISQGKPEEQYIGVKVLIGCIGVALIFTGWNQKPTLILFGILFSTIFISSIFTHPIMELFLTKLLLTLFTLGVVLWSSADASSLLNDIYAVDGALFPISKAFLTGIIFYKKITIPMYIIIVLSCILIILYICSNWEILYKNWGDLKLITYFLTIINLSALACFTYQFDNKFFADKLLKDKAFALASNLDFYSKNPCQLPQEMKKGKVLFLDPLYNKVLVDTTKMEEKNIWDIIKFKVDTDGQTKSKQYFSNSSSDTLPKIHYVECQMQREHRHQLDKKGKL